MYRAQPVELLHNRFQLIGQESQYRRPNCEIVVICNYHIPTMCWVNTTGGLARFPDAYLNICPCVLLIN